jgi:hypothetical protein
MATMNRVINTAFQALAFSSALIFALAALAGAQQKVGYVLDVEGTWILADPTRPLTAGEKLPESGLVRNDSRPPLDGDRIVIADLTGKIIKTIRCASGVCNECLNSGACYDRIRPLPKARAQTGLHLANFEEAMSLFLGNPDRYSAHRVRGINIPDGIAQLNDGQIDITPFFKGQEKAAYSIRFQSLLRDGLSGETWKSDRAAFDWDPGRPSKVSVSGIRPGLFKMDLEHDGEAINVWVLLCTATYYQEAFSRFDALTMQAEKWGDEVSADRKRAYLRAYLEYLASQSFGQDAGNASK